MTKKHKRGRPKGGKHPEQIRAYWREIQRNYRELHKTYKSIKKSMNVKE